MKNTTWINAFPPRGGLNKSTNPIAASFDTLTECDNVLFTSDFVRTQFPGQVRFDVDSASKSKGFPYVKLLYDFWFRNASNARTEKVIKINGGYISADGGGDGKFVDITGTTTLDADDVWTAETFGNRLILGSNTQTLYTYTGSGDIALLGGSPPNGRLVRKHAGRLWIAGVDSAPHTIYFSGAYDPTRWSGVGTGSLEIDPDDSDPDGITAIFPSLHGVLYVAKRHSIYAVTGVTPHTFQVSPVVQGIGCIHHNTADAVNNDIIFASARGIESLAAVNKGVGVETEAMSFPLFKLWQDEVNIKQARRMWGRFFQKLNSYVLLYVTGAFNYPTHALVYNIPLKAWSRVPGINLSSLAEIYQSGSIKMLVGRNDGVVGELKTGEYTNIGAEIRPYMKIGPMFPSASPYSDIAYKNLSVAFSTKSLASLNASYKIDNLQTRGVIFTPSSTGSVLGPGFILGTDALGSDPLVTIQQKPMQGDGKALSLMFEKALAGTPLGSSFILGTSALASGNSNLDFHGFAVEAIQVTESAKEATVI